MKSLRFKLTMIYETDCATFFIFLKYYPLILKKKIENLLDFATLSIIIKIDE